MINDVQNFITDQCVLLCKPPAHFKKKEDKLLYEKLVIDTMYTWASKQRKEYIEHKLDPIIDKTTLIKLIANAIKNMSMTRGILATGKYLRLGVRVRTPSRRLDKDTLKEVLMSQIHLTSEQVDEIVNKCSELSDPSKDYTVEEA